MTVYSFPVFAVIHKDYGLTLTGLSVVLGVCVIEFEINR